MNAFLNVMFWVCIIANMYFWFSEKRERYPWQFAYGYIITEFGWVFCLWKTTKGLPTWYWIILLPMVGYNCWVFIQKSSKRALALAEEKK